VKGCIYRLYFKPDEEVSKGAGRDDDEDLLTNDDKGNDADGDQNMRDANPARNPQGGHKDAFFANPQYFAPQGRKSNGQATLIQEALDMACEQLLDEISIKVMLEKDPMRWKAYNPLTDEERRLYNALVTPPVNPHPFIFGVFEKAGVTHLSSAGGTPTLFYLASTALPTEGGNGGMPIPILSGGTGSLLGAAPHFANDGGSEDADSTTSDRPTLPTAGGCFPLNYH
jgi:hypothetical protein